MFGCFGILLFQLAGPHLPVGRLHFQHGATLFGRVQRFQLLRQAPATGLLIIKGFLRMRQVRDKARTLVVQARHFLFLDDDALLGLAQLGLQSLELQFIPALFLDRSTLSCMTIRPALDHSCPSVQSSLTSIGAHSL